MARAILLSLLLTSLSGFASETEIAQAKEAAPVHITQNASYMVWEEDRFVTKIAGSNEFVCLVLTDGQGRFEPSCLNKQAMRSVFPVYEYQTRMLLQNMPIQEIYKNIEAMAKAKTLPEPGPGALVYMMSHRNKFYDHFSKKLLDVGPHVMLYLPRIEKDSLGFNNKDGLPMFYNEYPHLSVIHLHTQHR
ncbi:hypothetical protein [Pseudoalteromonas rubra]|uniref:Uncharacterized protein n=1 Tax=Pseudoalteromonas rubra TaxID=43658 RepID=A0A0U3HUG0_9GAMM|nr:hypothetical protein [Pseudoalteromonas rubra]ALU44600.1 hypothetical protein AT705_17650 [Pseudoalteromonas rubra]